MHMAGSRVFTTLLTLAVFLCFTASYTSCLFGMTDECCEEMDSGVPCTDGLLCHCACALASSMPVVMTLEFHTPYVGEVHETSHVSSYPEVKSELDRPPRPC